MNPISFKNYVADQNEPEIMWPIAESCPTVSGSGFGLEKSISSVAKCAAEEYMKATNTDRFRVSESAGNDNNKPDLVITVMRVVGKQFSGKINIEIKDENAQGTQFGLKNNFSPETEVTETSWVTSGKKAVNVAKDVWLGVVRAIHTKKFHLIRQMQEYIRTSLEPTALHKKHITPGKIPFGKVSKIAWKEVGNKGKLFTPQGDTLVYNINDKISDPENIRFYESVLQQKGVHFIYIHGKGLFSTGAAGAPQIPGIPTLSQAIKGTANIELRLKASGGSYSGGGEAANSTMVRQIFCNQDPSTAKNKSIYMEDWAGDTPSNQCKLYMFDDTDKFPDGIEHSKGNEVGKLVSVLNSKQSSENPNKWNVRFVMRHRTTGPTLQFTTRITSGNFAGSPYTLKTAEDIQHFFNTIP
jgi:hypothetical protein